MGRLLAGWFALTRRERWLLLVLVTGLPVVAGMLRVRDLVRTRLWLERLSEPGSRRDAGSDDLRAAERLTQLAAIAGRRGVITATCLRQSLLVYALLRRRGLAPELKFGVRKQGDALDAHAWVELQGVALGQATLTHLPFETRDPLTAG